MRRWCWTIGLVVALAACDDGGGGGGEEQDTTPTPDAAQDADVADEQDTPQDVVPSEVGEGTDSGPTDVTPPPDVPDADDVTPDADSEEDDAGPVCEHSCENQFGQEDPSLCPDPKSDWQCIDGCCVARFKCETDADCAEQGFDEGQCSDPRFDCRCEVDSGTCSTWFCAVDADCAEGETCAAGVCETMPEPAALEVRIASAATVLTTDAEYPLVAEAWDPSDEDVVVDADVTWTSDAPGIVDVTDDGVAIGGTTSGEAIITASLTDGSDMEDIIVLRNVAAAEGDTLTVVVFEERHTDPVSGSYGLVDSGTGAFLDSGPIPEDGVITWDGAIEAGIDVHVFGEGTDWVSWLGAQGGVLALPVRRTFWGSVVMDQEAEIVPEETVLKGANILRGEVGLGDYPKSGELELTLTSFPFASGLFDFNLTSIVGANVERYFDPDAMDLFDKDEPAEIPGGVTFAINEPAIPDFVLAAPKGRHHVWTLGGRIALDEITEFADILFDGFGGGSIDFGKLVSNLVPLFQDFWTTRTATPDIAGDGSVQVETITPALRVPLGLQAEVDVPPMPALGETGWPSTVFLIPGAVTAESLFVPLGLHAGPDTTDAEANPADGVVDPDESTPEVEPFDVPIAPLHTGLAGPGTRYTLAAVAVSLREGSGDPRPEGGSAIIHREAPGASPEGALELPDFLPFPMNSTWDAETRTLSVEPLADGDVQRVLFKGRTGEHWTIWLHGADTYQVPVPDSVMGPGSDIGDRTVDPELVLVNTFDLREGLTLDALAQPGGLGLDMLLDAVDRASFVDILFLSQ
ncbi:MAG: hypothetical protein ACQEXJ_04535 [Myxococcota bacterium]